MKQLILAWSRIKQYAQTNPLAFVFYLFGSVVCGLLLIYIYGNTIPAFMVITGNDEAYRSYSISMPEDETFDVKVLEEAVENWPFTDHGQEPSFLLQKRMNKDDFPDVNFAGYEYAIPVVEAEYHDQINLFAVQGRVWFDESDLEAVDPSIILPERLPLKDFKNEVFHIGDRPYTVIGRYTGFSSVVIPIEAFLKLADQPDFIVVRLAKFDNDLKMQNEIIAYLQQYFPHSFIHPPFYNGLNPMETNIISALLGILYGLALFSITFISKYLFEQNRSAHVIYRMAGCSRRKLAQITLLENVLLAFAVLIIHFGLQQSIHQVKGAALLLMVVFTLALFVLTYLIGLVRYHTYSLNLLERGELENSVYLKLAFDENQMNRDFYGTFASFQETYEQIATWPGVQEVVSIRFYGSVEIGQNVYPVIVYDEAVLRNFSVPLDGDWFPDEPAAIGSPLPVVLGGSGFSAMAVGDLVTGQIASTRQPITLQIYGKTKFPGYTLFLGNSSTEIITDYLLDDAPMILVRYDPVIRDMFDASDHLLIYENAWVVFDDGLAGQEKSQLLASLSSYGSYNTYDDIITASRASHVEQIKRILPIPLFLFFGAFFCLFSIASLYVLRNTQNQILYFFCGCSRMRLLLILGQGLFLIFLPPALLNLLFILFYPFLMQISWLNLHQVVFDGTAVLLVLLFLTVLLAFLLLQPLIINRRRSPLQLYRRMSS